MYTIFYEHIANQCKHNPGTCRGEILVARSLYHNATKDTNETNETALFPSE